MRAALFAGVWLVAVQAFAQTAGQSSDATSATSTSVSRDQRVADYPDRLADRPRAIGANLFEAAWDADWQINSIQGFGELPNLRYGVTDQFEITLLGARYIVVEDSSYIPGLALRAQLHDLSYQRHTGTGDEYPYLRPGGFVELRDRFPFHLAVNGTIGYEFSLQSGQQTDGTALQQGQAVSTGMAPMEVEVQWSPLPLFSFSVSGGYLIDTYEPAYEGVTQSEALLTAAAVLNTSRFDVRLFFTNNWFADSRLGYVPEIGAGAAVRL